MFERDEYRKILLSGTKGSLPWQTVTQVLLQSDHPFAQRFAQRSGNHKYFLSEKLRSKIQTMCESYIAQHRLTKQKDDKAWVDALWP